MMDERGRLAVISNRGPYQIKEKSGSLSYEKNIGGLTSVLDEIIRQAGGTWIAWGERDGGSERVGIPPDRPRYFLRPVLLSDQEVNDYYHGFSNRVLWPLSHYLLDRCHFRSDYWNAYQSVNEKFAAAFREQSRDHDLVWVHDFHLTLLPNLLRKQRPDLRIGFFWHIPFPTSPVFRVLPWREQVLRGLLGSDLIGFHLTLHATNFLQSVEDVIKVPVDRANGLIQYEGRMVEVGVFPVGIDFRKWNDLASGPDVAEKSQQIRSTIGAEKIFLGVDRLDYTKGIRERLLSYERFLEKYPDFHDRVCLVQIAVPSRTRVEEYRLLRREIDEAIGRITGRFSKRKWIPLRYLYRPFPVEELAAYYQAADVGLVTPLRDGMNLVAKEYVASRVQGDGVLILSEFTGAAGALTDAVLVNPYDIDRLADSIRLSLCMSEGERRERMRRLRAAVKEKDVYWWCESFLGSLERAKEKRP